MEAANPLLVRFLGRPRDLSDDLRELLLREGVVATPVAFTCAGFTCTGISPCSSNLRRVFQCMGFLDLEEAGVLAVDFFEVVVVVVVGVAGRGLAAWIGMLMGGGMVAAVTGAVVWIAVVTGVCC